MIKLWFERHYMPVHLPREHRNRNPRANTASTSEASSSSKKHVSKANKKRKESDKSGDGAYRRPLHHPRLSEQMPVFTGMDVFSDSEDKLLKISFKAYLRKIGPQAAQDLMKG